MKHSTGTFEGLHGVSIFTQQWLPDSAPRAAVLLVHGYAEHSGRYEHVARCLTGHGYAVYALDLRGHGQSGGDRVYVDQFEDYVSDLERYFEQVRAGGLPVFLYGHSMGTLVSLLFAARHQDSLAGLITSGTALRLVGYNRVTAALLGLLDHVIPHARLIPLDSAGLSHDPAVRQRYTADPLVDTHLIRVKMVSEMMRAGEDAARLLPALCLPYLALHGSADPITLPQGAAMIRAQCESPDLTVKMYDGLYHELHNEVQRDEVLRDIATWLDAHSAAGV